MKHSATALVLLLAALALQAADAPAEGLTWQEANKRSAALVREHGPSTEAAELARQAFDLYPQQTKSYSADSHAQLLLNLFDTRNKAAGVEAAVAELDRGVEAIQRHAGPKAPVLIRVWQEGARVGRGSQEGIRLNQRALALAEELFGRDDPRTLELTFDAVSAKRSDKGYAWTASMYRNIRERAAKASEDSALVAEIDLATAKLELEAGFKREAIEGYSALIDRLEKRPGRGQDALLQVAYAQLEHAYEEKGEQRAADDVRRRRTERLLAKEDTLVPLMRVTPKYPRTRREGFVEVRVAVGPDGSVIRAEVARAEPPGIFEESALEAIRQWKFKPKIVDGRPVGSEGVQRVDYRIDVRPARR